METPVSNPSAAADALREWIKTRSREESLRRMSPDRRALYERIIKRRDETGPIDFNIVEALRELRGDY